MEAQRVHYGPAVPERIDSDIRRLDDAIAETEAALDALNADSQHHLNSDGADDEQQAQMDATQLSRIENKLDAVNDRVYGLSARITYLERDTQEMAERMKSLEAQLLAMQRGPANIQRTWLLSGAALLMAVFVLVVILAWRLL